MLALLGSIGGSLVAFLILEKRQKGKSTPVAPGASIARSETNSSPAPEKPTVRVEAKASNQETNKSTTLVDESVVPDFQIVSRAEWKARPPVLEMKHHVPSRITVHHTATTAAPDKSLAGKLRNLQEFSQHEGTLSGGKKKPAWADIPYHFYIDVSGEVAEGRDINYVGDSNTDYDPSSHISVVLEGNFEKAEPTRAQMDALFKVVTWLGKKYKIPTDRINSHKGFASTACPGKNLEKRLEEIRQFGWKP